MMLRSECEEKHAKQRRILNKNKKQLYDKEYYAKNTEKRKKYSLKYHYAHRDQIKKYKEKYFYYKKYNLSLEELSIILTAQNNKCAICKSNFSKRNVPCIDHDHNTGQIRGILCRKCNLGLGLFNDNKELIISAFGYLDGKKMS